MHTIRNGRKYWQGIKFGELSENHQTAKFKTPPIFPGMGYMALIEDFYAIYSGVNEGRARAGVAVVLSEQLRRYVKSWKCVNERIVVVKLKVARECYTLV